MCEDSSEDIVKEYRHLTLELFKMLIGKICSLEKTSSDYFRRIEGLKVKLDICQMQNTLTDTQKGGDVNTDKENQGREQEY